MNRRTLIRGIQLIVAITLGTFACLVYDGIRSQEANLVAGFAGVKVGWLVLAAVLALQEGVCGGVRIWVLGRVLCRTLALRTAIISEFVLMFCAGVTPGQAGAAPSQIAVLAHGGMKFVDVATAELVAASCTIVFFLITAITISVLRANGLFVAPGAEQLDVLVLLSVAVFGTSLLGLVLGAAYPPLLKTIFRVIAIPLGVAWRTILRAVARTARGKPWADRRLTQRGAILVKLLFSVDDFHQGVRRYAREGKAAYAAAMLLTVGFFCSRFAVAYFILLGLGIPTAPASFVSVGPPIVQVILVQAALNFALYLSPTPGASGVAEAGSSTLMRPWVSGVYELPYLVLWRLLALFLCMFVGGMYVFRYLGADVLEKRIKANQDAQRALDEERLAESKRTAA